MFWVEVLLVSRDKVQMRFALYIAISAPLYNSIAVPGVTSYTLEVVFDSSSGAVSLAYMLI